MLVLSGIPKHLRADFVSASIRKTLAKFGGIFRQEIFVPPIESMKGSAAVALGQVTML
jgi:hypothetical protein